MQPAWAPLASQVGNPLLSCVSGQNCSSLSADRQLKKPVNREMPTTQTNAAIRYTSAGIALRGSGNSEPRVYTSGDILKYNKNSIPQTYDKKHTNEYLVTGLAGKQKISEGPTAENLPIYKNAINVIREPPTQYEGGCSSSVIRTYKQTVGDNPQCVSRANESSNFKLEFYAKQLGELQAVCDEAQRRRQLLEKIIIEKRVAGIEIVEGQEDIQKKIKLAEMLRENVKAMRNELSSLREASLSKEKCEDLLSKQEDYILKLRASNEHLARQIRNRTKLDQK